MKEFNERRKVDKEMFNKIGIIVENAVDKKINGKLTGIVEHLKKQDCVLEDVKILLQERKFVQNLWKVIKFIGKTIASVGASIVLWQKLKNQ